MGHYTACKHTAIVNTKHPRHIPSILEASSLAFCPASCANCVPLSTAQTKGVNELLADLRRVGVSNNGASPSTQITPIDAVLNPIPSVPPALRQVLRIPESPAPQQRSRRLVDAQGRRLPPGPPAPRSWLAQSRHAPTALKGKDHIGSCAVRGSDFFIHPLPGVNVPERGSLLDLALSTMVADWEYQRHYNQYWLYTLPDHLRLALICYLGSYRPNGASPGDLKRLLLPPPDLDPEDESPKMGHTPNEGIHTFDMVDGFGKATDLKELSDILFPRRPAEVTHFALQESWDAPADTWSAPMLVADVRPSLLPSLTRVSLAVNPSIAHKMSWKHLLSFSSHLATVTHLSLAYWPRPTLTPNAVASVIDSPSGSIQYGGTGFYSHSLDDDWTEAILLLRRLSKNLYGLEYLDVTGCASWTEALIRSVDHDSVDWQGAWGKITELLMYWGYRTPKADEEQKYSEFLGHIALATRVERHIIGKRSGRGRFVEVLRDAVPDE